MKKLFILSAIGCMALGLNAKPITPAEALNRLGGATHKAAAVKGKSTPKLAHTARTKGGNPAVYIFNRGDNGGYLVLSADDIAYPMLGYSDSGSFNADNMPPQMEWWLSEYARQIEYAAGKEESSLMASYREGTRAQREAIAPMIKTKWDQGEPYNNSCPKIGANRGYTGCVATAMAQVMNYWQYPEVGQGKITYTSESLSKKLTLDFSKQKFDWANMCDTYLNGQYTEAEANAVAYLMKAAGFAVKMDYSADSSGALAMNIGNALTKYFKYDGNIDYQLRLYYNATEWEEMIYNNLKNVGPILYGGGSMIGGGHSFICDGYDGEGLFHFNWGWSGMSDGYFSLDALNPGALGAGGGGGGGYNFTQDAVLGIQPPTGKPVVERPTILTQMGSLAAEVKNDSIKFDLFGEDSAMWVNYNPTTLKMKIGTIIEPQGTTPGSTTYQEMSSILFDLQAGYGTNPKMMKDGGIPLSALSGLADGTYKITAATTLVDEEPQTWTPVKPSYGYFNYVVLKKQGSTFTVDSEPIVVLDLLDIQITNKLYFGGLANVYIKVSNDSDLELTKGFAPAFIYVDKESGNSGLFFLGESVFVTVPPHSQIEKKWDTSLYAMQNIGEISSAVEFELGVFDESTYNFFISNDGNPVTMYPNAGAPQLQMIGTAKLGGELVQETLPNGNQSSVYLIDDPLDIDVSTTLRLTKGIFCYNALAFLTKPEFIEGGEQVAILAMAGMPMYMESTGLRQKFEATLSYPLIEPGEYYAVMMGYQYGSNYVGISGTPSYFRLKGGSSAVEELPAEEVEAGDGEIYNLQGMSLGKDLDKLPAGLYIRNGKKILKK